MVFGAFDGIHPGHIDFFKQAKKLGDFLCVSVGTDKNVKAIKGRKAHFNQAERLGLVTSIKQVDEAILGAEKDFYKEIKKHSPDVICLGYDQWANEEDVRKELKKVGLNNILVIRLKPYKETKAKSTIVKKRSVDY